MKKITITCDHCNKDVGDNCIEIGTENGNELHYRNSLPDNSVNTIHLSRYRDLHFCSQEHFINFFFLKLCTT